MTHTKLTKRAGALRALLGCGLALGAVGACAVSTGASQTVKPSTVLERLLPPPSEQGAGSSSHPNVVLVLTDDLSMDLLRFMPHVRAMERRGLTFENYFVS